ncbi:MAG: sugar MFS transporter, partial [Acetanaerobacterium sp.]
MQPEYGTPYSFAGLLSAVSFGATIVSSFLSVRAIRRFGTGKVTVVSVLLTGLSMLGICLSHSFYVALALCIPLGLGGGAVDTGLNAYVAEHYKSRHMSWLHCFWGVGAMLGPVIMSRGIAGGSWHSGYLNVSLIQLSLFILLLVALPLWDKAVPPVPENPADADGQAPSQGMLYSLKIRGVKPVLLSFLLYCGVEVSLGLWGASYLIAAKGLSAAQAAQWVSFFFLGITAGRFLTGFATIKLNNITLIRMGEFIILVGTALLLLPLPVLVSAAGFVLVGLGCAPIFPCMLHETPARFGKKNARVIMSFQFAFAYVGCSVLPPVFGVIAEYTSFLTLPCFLAAYTLFMLLCTERVNRIMKHKVS